MTPSERLLGDLMAAQLALALHTSRAKAGEPHKDLAALKQQVSELRDCYAWTVFNETALST